MRSNSGVHLRRLIITAIFLAIALILRQFFSFYIPLFGVAGMRVGVAAIFTRMPAILFGPVWGALISGLNDVLGFVIRPTGTFLYHLTITAATSGFVCGAVWLLLRNKNVRVMRIIILLAAVLSIGFGLSNMLIFKPDEVTNLISVPIGAGILGLVLCGADILLSFALKNDYKEYSGIMPLLIAMLAAAWWQSTLNTIVFRNTIWQESLGELPFTVVWLPRILQATITTLVHTYFVAVLLGIAKGQKWLRLYLK